MASTYSDRLRLELMATGENDATWGTKLNTVVTLIEDAISGWVSVTHDDSASYTLTTSNGGTDEARNMVIHIAGTLTAARNTICPTKEKVYIVKNGTTGGYATTFKTAAGTGVSIANGSTSLVYCDGTNVVDVLGASSFATLTGAETLTNKTLTAPIIATISNSGTITLPTGARTLVARDTTDTLTNKTLTAPTVTNADNTTQALTWTAGGTTTWDMANGAIATVTASGGNTTFGAPSNLKKGTYILRFTQDSTPRTAAWNSVFKWSNGIAPTLSSGSGAIDILTFYCNGTHLYGSMQADFS